MRDDPIVGIDLGTTNSLVAIAHAVAGEERRAGRALIEPRVLLDDDGRAMLASAVRIDPDGVREPVIGEEAREGASLHPETTILSVKRLMGRSRADAERSGDLAYLGYRVVDGPRGNAAIEIPGSGGGGGGEGGGAGGGAGSVLLPIEISAMILGRLKRTAEARLGETVHRAVVTVPAYFDDAQRQATRDAGRLAGLEVVRIINEPTAAALAYGLGVLPSAGRESQNIVVFDLGGGTFDVSVLRLTPAAALEQEARGADLFQVLATAGDTHLGGDDFDHALVGLFMSEIRDRFGGGGELEFPAQTRQALRALGERVKIRLSDHETASVRLDLGPGPAGEARVYERQVTRPAFERLIEPQVKRALECCGRVMADARRALGGESVSAVIMVGGSTRVPLVRERVREFFGLEPYTGVDPDQVVALGAAVQAGVLWNAGRSGGSKAGEASSLLLDVVPLSLGIETVGGAMAKLIMRNSSVPARASEMFSTSVDNQTAIRLNVLQGEREMAADCRSLGVFEVRGLPAMPAGIPQVRVEFLVDANGVLSVQAVEQRSGKRARMQVVPNHGLTREEVERLERESLTHAREDMTRHRIADLVANVRLDIKWIRRQLERLGNDLEPAYRGELESRLAELGAMVEAGAADWRAVDADRMHKAKEDLDRASMRLHEVAIANSLREDPPKR